MNDNDLTQINWLQQLAKEYLKELKRRRRFRILLKVMLVIIIASIVGVNVNQHTISHANTPHVASIKIEGGLFSDSKNQASNIIKGLQLAYKNPNVKAIFLEINSPGGSPVQADEVYQSIRYFKKQSPQKPVIAICGDVCASAAYYIAAAADDIYANPSSLVGSIGVIMNGVGVVDLMDKIGLSRRVLTAGKYKDIYDPMKPVTAKERQLMQSMLDEVHQQFIDSVKAGRGKRLINDETVFSGLFWSGKQAKRLGLIDGFGSADRLMVTKYHHLKKFDYTQKEDFYNRIVERLATSITYPFKNQITSVSIH